MAPRLFPVVMYVVASQATSCVRGLSCPSRICGLVSQLTALVTNVKLKACLGAFLESICHLLASKSALGGERARKDCLTLSTA